MSEKLSSSSPEILDSRKFFDVYQEAGNGTAFRLMDGVLDDPDELDMVVSLYDGAHARDLVDVLGKKHREHGEAAFGIKKNPVPFARVRIEYLEGARWSFDADQSSFHAKRIMLHTPEDELVTASLVKTTAGFNMIDCWLVKDTR